ncbi:hypothetical protein V6N13_053057 [Hibiscus sabdariffa]
MEKESSFMQILFCKLKRLKSALSRFNAEHYGGISLRVRDKARELEEVQLLNLHETVDDSLLEKEKELYKELKVLLSAEESFFKQKSRVQWVQEDCVENESNKFSQESFEQYLVFQLSCFNRFSETMMYYCLATRCEIEEKESRKTVRMWQLSPKRKG